MGESEELAAALTAVGRRVRDVVLAGRHPHDRSVVRNEGGDDVFGVDARADVEVLRALDELCAARWPGRLVMEGFDDQRVVGDPDGDAGTAWTYLVDPVDGTRGLLADLHSAWVLIGAGRDAQSLDQLEIGVVVEIPTSRSTRSRVVAGTRQGPVAAFDDDLVHGGASALSLRPAVGVELERAFVTVVRHAPGTHGPIGAWADTVLADLVVFDDLYPCSGGQLFGVMSGATTAVLDPRPLFGIPTMCAHPYDLAAVAVAQAMGVVVEAIPPGPLRAPIDTGTDVAWAAYANEETAAVLRPRVAAACALLGS